MIITEPDFDLNQTTTIKLNVTCSISEEIWQTFCKPVGQVCSAKFDEIQSCVLYYFKLLLNDLKTFKLQVIFWNPVVYFLKVVTNDGLKHA